MDVKAEAARNWFEKSALAVLVNGTGSAGYAVTYPAVALLTMTRL